jgi:hypothetical protein
MLSYCYLLVLSTNVFSFSTDEHEPIGEGESERGCEGEKLTQAMEGRLKTKIKRVHRQRDLSTNAHK